MITERGGRRIDMYAITGATGNIGSKIADILLAQGEPSFGGRHGVVEINIHLQILPLLL
jgi:hypothetical protein